MMPVSHVNLKILNLRHTVNQTNDSWHHLLVKLIHSNLTNILRWEFNELRTNNSLCLFHFALNLQLILIVFFFHSKILLSTSFISLRIFIFLRFFWWLRKIIILIDVIKIFSKRVGDWLPVLFPHYRSRW